MIVVPVGGSCSRGSVLCVLLACCAALFVLYSAALLSSVDGPRRGGLSRIGAGSAPFSLIARDLQSRSTPPVQAAAEALIARHMRASTGLALAARWPLPELPVVVELNDGTCLVGHCAEMRRGSATWTHDAHIRDVISSVLLPCALAFVVEGGAEGEDGGGAPPPCYAIDVGSNFGLHTLSMLRLGAHVLSVEPQTDLCVASRASVALQRWGAGVAPPSSASVILCGGVAPSSDTPAGATLTLGGDPNGRPFRYDGPQSVPNYDLPASVPLYTVRHLVDSYPRGALIRLVKIDTDSIDCAVLGQFLDLIDEGRIDVGAFILESWDSSCRSNNAIGRHLLRLVDHGFTIYRTDITERAWDENHADTKAHFEPIAHMPPLFVEQFCQRFNFAIWKLDARKVAGKEGREALLEMAAQQSQYQYVFAREAFFTPGYI